MTDRGQTGSPSGWRRHWPLIKKVLTVAFFVLVAGLLVALTRNVDWNEVYRTLRDYNTSTLMLAGAAALASYLVYGFYDVLGKHYVQHNLPIRQILPVTFVCYAFNLNLTALVGGIALRFRLYSRFGLRASQITRIFTLSIVTNWMGYISLAGLVFALGWIAPPAEWEVSQTVMRLLAAGLLLAAMVYVLACGFSRRRNWQLRGQEIQLPNVGLALIQLLLGATNWALMALVMYFMLSQQVPYPTVLGILMISSIAGVIAHIPAGLGVLEAVFVAMLAGTMSKGSVIAGLIGYRVVYFLIPLLLATLVYLLLEARARKLRSAGEERLDKPSQPEKQHPPSTA